MLLDDISFNINNGDITSIIGPNGSGKSTLVKLISGELDPSSGNILINDISNSMWNMVELSKYRSVLPQSNHLSFPFSVLDIVKMGRYPYRDIEKTSISEKICKNIIDIFDLNDFIDQNYVTLSGGEKQRVQLARVLAQIWSENNYEKLLILDEPTSYLDISHQYALFDLLKDLNTRGLTIVMVLHDLNHALLYSSKLVMLKDAKLVSFGDTSKVATKSKLEDVFNVGIYMDNNKGNPYIIFSKKGVK
tara:strand:+ start:91 stop:834 length:744 start_codon:yes stop_codon:yes gene_type:complete